MRRLYSAVVLLIVAALFGCGGSHSASLTPQSSLNGAVPASSSRSALGSTSGSGAEVAAASPPASPIKVSPAAVALVAAGQTQTVTVSEPGYSGNFSATSSDPTIATASPVVSGQATVTAVAQGATSLTVVDQLKPKHTTKVPVTVGLAQFVLQQYRSHATQSIALYANGQTTYVNLAAPPNSCTNFSVSCLLSAPEVVGVNAFVISLYDGQNGTGNLLSTGTVSAQITSPSSPQKFSLPLGGAVSTLTIALGNPTPPPGTPTTSSVNITGLDADGNAIIGTGLYVNSSGKKLSVSIADSDMSGITSVQPKTVSKPATPPLLSYNGTPLPSGATITASAPGVTPVTALFAPHPAGASKIYVTNANGNGNGNVMTYGADGSPSTPTITGLSNPLGVAVDATGKIYVTDSSTNTLTTYNADGSGPVLTINAGLSGPAGVAVDAVGKIYVANLRNNTVTTYNSDGSTSAPTITGLSQPIGIAVDSAGKIYVTNAGNGQNNGTVATYTSDGTPTTPTITGLNEPFGVCVDAAAEIHVTSYSNNRVGTVTTYNADGTQTTPTIAAGLGFPQGIAVDAAGNIYVTSFPNSVGTVTTYKADGSPTTPTITNLIGPFGIAVH